MDHLYPVSRLLPCWWNQPIGVGVVGCHSPIPSILFAYARDKAVPLPWLWIKYCKTTESPLVAVYGIAFMSWLIALPMLGNEVGGGRR
jgi:hypothetical protein